MQVDRSFQPIQWTDNMATGIATIDAQHHYLVDTLHQANDKLLGGHDAALLDQVSRDLLNYAIMHFETEEALMQQYGYAAAHPELARNHIAQHRAFSRAVVEVCDRLRARHHVSEIEVLKYLNEWLLDHVMGIDQLLGRFLREAGAQDTAANSD